MSAGIAHDFRNPLTAISGSAQVLANEINLIQSPQQQQNADLLTLFCGSQTDFQTLLLIF